MEITNANSNPITRLQTWRQLPNLHPTTNPSADLSNWRMQWWDAGGLDLEELDQFLGFRCLSRVADTIDPRCLISEDVVETSSEGPWTGGRDVSGGIGTETEYMEVLQVSGDREEAKSGEVVPGDPPGKLRDVID